MIKYLKNDEEFESIISSGVTLVDFYADWCGPCRRMGEVLETLTEVNVLKINTDEFPNLATSFGVMSIPTLILFIDGAESGKLIGLQSKDDILDFINKK
ncbi:MAG: thioredoxin [Bacilli bacterium]|jgi:thioredoxin 1|nr:thioredoxin [Bacilli bacterium]